MARVHGKIENETFNTLKSQDYWVEYDYGQRQEQLSTVLRQAQTDKPPGPYLWNLDDHLINPSAYHGVWARATETLTGNFVLSGT